jgi:hypothetical protein
VSEGSTSLSNSLAFETLGLLGSSSCFGLKLCLPSLSLLSCFSLYLQQIFVLTVDMAARDRAHNAAN